MVGDNRNRWTAEQLMLMAKLHAQRMPWADIAPAVGHPKSACQVMMSKLRNQQRGANFEAIRVAAHAIRALVKPKPKPVGPAAPVPRQTIVPLPVKKADADFARSSISTAKLVMDAELRARIEVMGITGGLLGDPLPGRSALDRRRQ